MSEPEMKVSEGYEGFIILSESKDTQDNLRFGFDKFVELPVVKWILPVTTSLELIGFRF